jgi:hypothetical protein
MYIRDFLFAFQLLLLLFFISYYLSKRFEKEKKGKMVLVLTARQFFFFFFRCWTRERGACRATCYCCINRGAAITLEGISKMGSILWGPSALGNRATQCQRANNKRLMRTFSAAVGPPTELLVLVPEPRECL